VIMSSKPIIGINVNYSENQDKLSTIYYLRGECKIGIQYVDSVYKAGGIPLLVPCIKDEKILKYYVEQVDGFLFIGGRDYPPKYYKESIQEQTKLQHDRRSSVDIILAKLVLKKQIPVLGICAGIQIINITSGGKLIQHLPAAENHRPKEDQTHGVKITGGKILTSLFGAKRIFVNSSHHQAVDPEFVGSGLQVVAEADDGTVEAIESTEERFILGVQWHPERIRDLKHRKKIFSAFINTAEKFQENKSKL